MIDLLRHYNNIALHLLILLTILTLSRISRSFDTKKGGWLWGSKDYGITLKLCLQLFSFTEDSDQTCHKSMITAEDNSNQFYYVQTRFQVGTLFGIREVGLILLSSSSIIV